MSTFGVLIICKHNTHAYILSKPVWGLMKSASLCAWSMKNIYVLCLFVMALINKWWLYCADSCYTFDNLWAIWMPRTSNLMRNS